MTNILEKLTKEVTENLFFAEEIDGCNALAEAIQKEYDKLCPRPEEFPEGWTWYALDEDGVVFFFKEKPEMTGYYWGLDYNETAHEASIPLGIDWRLCCWSIEDAKRIWEDE